MCWGTWQLCLITCDIWQNTQLYWHNLMSLYETQWTIHYKCTAGSTSWTEGAESRRLVYAAPPTSSQAKPLLLRATFIKFIVIVLSVHFLLSVTCVDGRIMRRLIEWARHRLILAVINICVCLWRFLPRWSERGRRSDSNLGRDIFRQMSYALGLAVFPFLSQAHKVFESAKPSLFWWRRRDRGVSCS